MDGIVHYSGQDKVAANEILFIDTTFRRGEITLIKLRNLLIQSLSDVSIWGQRGHLAAVLSLASYRGTLARLRANGEVWLDISHLGNVREPHTMICLRCVNWFQIFTPF